VKTKTAGKMTILPLLEIHRFGDRTAQCCSSHAMAEGFLEASIFLINIDDTREAEKRPESGRRLDNSIFFFL
jgi:hypothetical protein